MTEIEIKLQVPAESRDALTERLRALGARNMRLRTAYFDTEDALLARHGIAWRVRRVGRRWVQTLKAGEGLVREEHEVNVAGGTNDWPIPDPTQHRGSPAGARLERLLNQAASAATERFRTDFNRLSVPLRTRRGWVELSLDRGAVEAGASRAPICELEIELIQGSPRAVTEVAAILIKRHGLWLDLRSKAQRGHMLAAGMSQAPARGAAACGLFEAMGMEEAWRSVARSCGAQILTNASQIASDEGYDAEHIHQLRVGIRRLRTAIRLFQSVIPEAERMSAEVGELARQLGASRDRDVMAEELWPALARAGAPLVDLTDSTESMSPAQIVRSQDHQHALLRLLERYEAPSGALSHCSPPDVSLKTSLSSVLDEWHRSILRKSRRFDALDQDQRHRLRRQLKRLRYGLEFCEGLFSQDKSRRLLRALSRAQASLGDYNDAMTALEAYRARAETDPRAWFAAGWLMGRMPETLDRCRKTIGCLLNQKRAWPKPARTPRITAPIPPEPDPSSQ